MRVAAAMTGTDKLLAALRAYGEKLPTRVARGNEAAFDVLYDDSQDLVPVDTGALKESGYHETRGYGWERYSEVGYGRAGFPGSVRPSVKQKRNVYRYPYQYAQIVHFNPLNRVYEQGADMFLLTPLLESRDKMRRALRDKLGVP